MNGMIAWWGRNPIAGNLLMLACIVAGVLAYFSMEKEFFPAGAFNQVTVNVTWAGASPEDIESQVTIRLEEAVANVDGIDWMRSRSGEGFAWISVSVDPSADVEAVTTEIRSRVESVSGLPSAIDPPRVTRNQGGDWQFLLSVSGDVDERTLRDTAERLRDRISLIEGASQTSVFGGRFPEVSIELSETAMRSYGLTFDEVARSVRGSSLNTGGGAVRTDQGAYQLQVRNLADTAIEFSQIVIRQTPDGGVVRVGDVAKVIDGFQDVDGYTTQNGGRALLIAVETPEKANLPETAKDIRELLETTRATLPEGMKIVTVFDQSEDYESLTGILFSNALQGFALIFILLMLTLHPRLAFWATAGVITAFAGSFIILPILDVSLNFLTVFSFLLVLGIMVDDAIIVGEAIYERIERGERGADAAILATQLVLKPLVASVVTTMMAFAPWAFLSGDVTQFTRTITIVVISTLVFSLVECLLILPAHLSHVTPLHPGPGVLGRLAAAQVACANSLVWFAQNLFGPFMRQCVRLRYITLAVFVGGFAMIVAVFTSGRIEQTFFPDVEGDFLQISIDLPQTTAFSRVEDVSEQLDAARVALEAETAELAFLDPNTGQESFGVVRSWTQAIDNTSVQAWIGLTPPQNRPDLRTSEIRARLVELLGEVQGAERVSIEFGGGGGGGSAIQIALLGDNQDELRLAVEELKVKLLSYSEVLSVSDSEEAATEELQLKLKPGAEQLGVTLQDVSRQVRQAYFGEEVQRLPRDGDDVRVYVRYPREDRRNLESLSQFRVRAADGREIPLSAVADIEFAPGVTALDRRQRQRTITVEAEAPDAARARIMRDLNREFFPGLTAKYPSVSRRSLGQAESQQEFFAEILQYGVMALFAMYALLAIIFRSYAQPILIMSVIPFAFVGATVGHFVFGQSFALFSYLGMIAAMGVIVNDNVVLVDKANRLREEGAEAFAGVTEAAISRFRQIFLTSITEFVGLLPMIFEDAVIAQFLKPMAIGLAFGVALALPATLILAPALYMIGKDIKDAVGGVYRTIFPAAPMRERPREDLQI